MKKTSNRMNVREEKAEALDVFVKKELARTKAVDLAKIAKLKALRLARDQEESNPAETPQPETTMRKRKTMHLRITP